MLACRIDGDTPTTVTQVGTAAPGTSAPSGVSLIRRPSGSSLPKCIVANRWLMIAVSWPVVPSSSSNPRPRTILQPERFEIPRTDHQLGDGRRLFARRERTALDRQKPAVAPAQRHVRCDHAGLNAARSRRSAGRAARRKRAAIQSSDTSVPAAPGASSGDAPCRRRRPAGRG